MGKYKMKEILKLFPREIIINKSLYNVSETLKKVPGFAKDYLVSQLIDPKNPKDGITKINRIIDENFVDSDKKELIKSRIRSNGRYSFLGYLLCKFDQYKDEYFANISVLDDNNIRINNNILEKFGESLLTGGSFGNIVVAYDPNYLIKNKNYPFIITDFIPFQITNINMEEYIQKRNLFTSQEWIDFLINSIGFNPDCLTQEQKLIYLCRLIPFVEQNINMIELGPTETAKTHCYRNISQYSLILSGSNPSIASLFYNKLRRTVGIICQKDVLVFDEISSVKLDNQELLTTLKDYMNSGKFSRDKTELSSSCGVVFLGNIDCDREKQEPKNYYQHLFMPLPKKINCDRAFLDRIHGYIPGWKLPRISVSSLSVDYGFQSDYLSEIFHRLRDKDYSDIIKSRIDFKNAGFRDQQAVTKLSSALLKIIFPSKNQTTEELKWIIDLAISLRQRVVDQLAIISPGEFKNQEIKYEIKGE